MRLTKPWTLTTAQFVELHQFLADRLADLGPAASADPLVAGANAMLIVHGDLIQHADHGALDSRDAGYIDGFGLALRHLAVRWNAHPAFQSAWAPPRVPVTDLLEVDYR
jgi:hypothetical protein